MLDKCLNSKYHNCKFFAKKNPGGGVGGAWRAYAALGTT